MAAWLVALGDTRVASLLHPQAGPGLAAVSTELRLTVTRTPQGSQPGLWQAAQLVNAESHQPGGRPRNRRALESLSAQRLTPRGREELAGGVREAWKWWVGSVTKSW